MTLPSGSSANFQVILDFLINNEEVLKRVAKETEGLTDATQQAAAAEKVLREEADKIAPGLAEQAKAEQMAKEAAKQHTAEIRTQIKEIRAQAREIQARNRVLLDTAQDIDRIAKPLQQYGLLVVGGIFAAANKYVNSAKEATEVTVAWKKAQDSLNQSGMRIGAILAQEALPLLKQAAEITEKIASFIEKHPEIVGTTLKAGLLAVTLGTIGKAVSGGIKLYADFKMGVALELQLKAAEMQLLAAQTQVEASGVKSLVGGKSPVTGGIGATITSALGKTVGGLAVGELVAIIGGIFAGVKGYDALVGGKNGYAESSKFAPAAGYKAAEKIGSFYQPITGMSDKEIERKAVVFAAVIGKLTHAIDENSPLWQKAAALAKGHTNSLREELAARIEFLQESAKLNVIERAEKLKALVSGTQEEIKLIRAAQLEKLRATITGFMQEAALRRQGLKAGLTDLANMLTAELKMKRDAFAAFIKSIADMFKNALNYLKSLFGMGTSGSTVGTAGGGSSSGSVTATSSSSGTASSTWSLAGMFGTLHDTGGYTPKGIYRMAWDGNPEFTLSGPSTKAMERIVGGQLTQANILQASQRGSGQQIVWNDNRRFDGDVTEATRRAVRQDTEKMLRSAFA